MVHAMKLKDETFIHSFKQQLSRYANTCEKIRHYNVIARRYLPSQHMELKSKHNYIDTQRPRGQPIKDKIKLLD